MKAFARLIGLIVSFLLLAAVFSLLARYAPGQKGQRFLRRGFRLDVVYWFFTPLVTDVVSKVAVFAVAALMVLALGLSWESLKHNGYHGFGPLSRLPLWSQALQIFVLADLVGYWTHRLFHRRTLWRFHSIHHCSTELDWLSSVRLHPVNEALNRIAEVMPLFLAGYNPKALAAYVPLITLYAIFLHANVNWDYGPLRFVFASPVFHRWHHSKEADAIDKNFAGFIVLWDVLFGTYYVPRGIAPQNFGVHDPLPESLWGQLAYPFRHRS